MLTMVTRRRRKPPIGPLAGLPTAPEMKVLVEQELEPWLNLIEKTWNFRPNLAISTRYGYYSDKECVVVRADFNILGFAHEGRRMYINAEAFKKRRSPKVVAKEMISEIVSHRNTCIDCGRGMATLHGRAAGPYPLSPDWEKKDSKYWKEMELENKSGFRRSMDRNAEGNWVPLYLDLMTPPDAVETAMFPKVAAKLRERLETQEAKAVMVSPERQEIIERIKAMGCPLSPTA